MRLYRFGKLGSLDALGLQEAEPPRPGPGQVTVRIRACSLNHRDLNIASMCAIEVGSRDMFEAMVRAMEVAKLEPVIDRVFDFTEARSAYEHLASGRHFGKVVVRV